MSYGGYDRPLHYDPRTPIISVERAQEIAQEALRKRGWQVRPTEDGGWIGPREAGLRAALVEAIEELEDMLPYVPEYFAQKWGYGESITRLKAVLENS